jgi:hypothetical protein
MLCYIKGHKGTWVDLEAVERSLRRQPPYSRMPVSALDKTISETVFGEKLGRVFLPMLPRFSSLVPDFPTKSPCQC